MSVSPGPAPITHRVLRGVGADILAPLGIYAALALTMLGDLARSPGAVVARQFQTLRAEDYLGTVWFYWWTHDALSRGHPILHPDVVCAPGGTSLGRNFPNWVDAFLAWPFFHWLPFPASYNLFCTAIPVLGALSAYWALRTLTRQRALAGLGGALFGFNAYSFAEIVAGRPSTALVFVIPLFLAVWLKALSTPGRRAWGWMLLAAPTAALVVYYHPIYTVICALLAVGTGLARWIWPWPGVSRWRPPLAGGVTGVLGGWLTTPYLYQITALQGRLSTPSHHHLAAPSPHLLPPWSLDLWRYLVLLAQMEWHRWVNTGGSPPPQGNPLIEAEIWQRMVGLSLPVDHLWREGAALTDPSYMLYPGFLVAAVLLLAALGGRRALGWMGLAAAFYLLTLGPWAAWRAPSPTEFALTGGSRLRMPTWYLAKAVPATMTFLKPYRVFPGLLLALSAALVIALDTLPRRVTGRWSSLTPRLPWLRRAMVLLGILLVGTALLRVGAALTRTRFLVRYRPNPFHLQLAADPSAGAIIELPVGLGHVLAGFQAVHGRPRSEGHHDEIAALKGQQEAPTACYRLPLLQALWHLGRRPSAAEPAAVPHLTPQLFRRASASGYRHLLVYLSAYPVLEEQGLHYDVELVLQTLVDLLGEPEYRDEALVAFSIPAE